MSERLLKAGFAAFGVTLEPSPEAEKSSPLSTV